MAKHYEAVFLSPHFDDAVLSCGGLIARLSLGGPVLVVTLFGGGEKRYPIVGKRLEEEKRAASILNYESLVWPFEDAVYRSSLNRIFLFRSRGLLAKEKELVKNLSSSMANLNLQIRSPLFYLPLGVGSHVDHRIVFEAGVNSLPVEGIRFYEDQPYSLRLGKVKRRLRGIKNWGVLNPRIEIINPFFEKKILGISAYASQIKPLLGSLNRYRSLSGSYAKKITGDSENRIERYWETVPVNSNGIC